MPPRHWGVVIGTLLWLTGCTLVPPATDVPPVLFATPGLPVQVTGDTLHTVAFTLRYPGTWRVITSEAGAAPTVTLVNPTATGLLLISTEAARTPLALAPRADDGPPTLRRAFSVARLPGGARVYVYAVGYEDVWANVLAVRARVLTSLRGPQTPVY